MKRKSIELENDIFQSTDSSEDEYIRNEDPVEELTIEKRFQRKSTTNKQKKPTEDDCQMPTEVEEDYIESGPKDELNRPINLMLVTEEQ